MKRICANNYSTEKEQASNSPLSKKLKRDIETALLGTYLPPEVYYRFFSHSIRNTYKPLLAYRCVNREWNELTDEFLYYLVNFKNRKLDHFTKLYVEPSILRYKVDPTPEAFYKDRLSFFSQRIGRWAQKEFFYDANKGSFVLKIDGKARLFANATPIDQFLLFKFLEHYFFLEKFLSDALNPEMDTTLNAVFNFLLSIKSSSTCKELLTRLIEHIYNLSINHPSIQSCIALSTRFVENKLINFDQIQKLLLHAISLLDPDKRELSAEIMGLLVNCILSLQKETVTFLNEDDECKNKIIGTLIAILSENLQETRGLALELLSLFSENNCLQPKQDAIIIDYLGKSHWVFDIWLLTQIRVDRLMSDDLRSKISFQFVNNIFKELQALNSEDKDIYDSMDFEGLTRDHIEDLLVVFEAFYEDRYFDTGVKAESSNIVELSYDILERLGYNLEDYERWDEFVED